MDAVKHAWNISDDRAKEISIVIRTNKKKILTNLKQNFVCLFFFLSTNFFLYWTRIVLETFILTQAGRTSSFHKDLHRWTTWLIYQSFVKKGLLFFYFLMHLTIRVFLAWAHSNPCLEKHVLRGQIMHLHLLFDSWSKPLLWILILFINEKNLIIFSPDFLLSKRNYAFLCLIWKKWYRNTRTTQIYEFTESKIWRNVHMFKKKSDNSLIGEKRDHISELTNEKIIQHGTIKRV